MTVQIPLRIPERDLEDLDRAIAAGAYKNRSDALRAGLKAVLKQIREREIEEAYRRGYGKYPQEEWIGEPGLSLFEAWHRAEGGDPL